MDRISSLLILALIAGGCGFGDSSRDDDPSGALQGDVRPPSFAAEPFAYTKSAWATSLRLDADVDCVEKMQQSNRASALLAAAIAVADAAAADDADADADADAGSGTDLKVALGMASYSYAMSLFYDCNMRQQAAEDGAKVVATDDDKIVYRAYHDQGELWDMTRFVTWSEYKDDSGTVPATDGEADTVDGRMVNLYLQDDGEQEEGDQEEGDQDDGARTQTRIELEKKNTLRELRSLFFLQAEAGKVCQRSHLVEYDDGTNKEHLLSLRLYHAGDEQIYLALSHMKASGSVVLIATCDIAEGEDYNKSCDGADFTTFYLDAQQEEITADQPVAQFKASKEEFLQNIATKWAHGAYNKDNMNPLTPFFAGDGDTEANRKSTFSAGVPSP